IDAFIAKKNIEAYRKSGKIDTHYLTSLSNDAIPYLMELAEDSSTEVSHIVTAYLQERRQSLQSSEDNNLLRFNFSESRARRLLER
ncbi:MAG: DUF4173 domain-containing protein, partial [Deltaproteobacteria bacterium]|nr:DUF4173 domain-containing protein [Deltaproteobacteria bacterium]